MDFVLSFRKDDSKDSRSHPCQVVVEVLGAKDPALRKLHGEQLGNWYQAYAGSRSMPFLYKEPAVEPWYKTYAVIRVKCAWLHVVVHHSI